MLKQSYRKLATTCFVRSAPVLSMDPRKSGGHFKQSGEFWPNPTKNEIWSSSEIAAVTKTHLKPAGISDTLASTSVKLLRFSFDLFSGYKFGQLTESKVLTRAIFLETVAGVPGFTAAILRHLRSLRRMERDYGFIHTLLQEAENERMHLLTFLKLKQPGTFFRFCVLIAQGTRSPHNRSIHEWLLPCIHYKSEILPSVCWLP